MPPRRPCIFFDRDGVLNRAEVRDGKAYSPRRFADFHLLPEAAAVVDAVKDRGYLAIVVTNQPDIARGLMPQAELDRMLTVLRDALPVDAIYVCPHDDRDDCSCRKPLPGMLHQAAEYHHLDLAASCIVGDSWKDIEAGRAAGCTTVLLARSYNCDAIADYAIDALTDLPALLDTLNGATPP